MSGFSGSGTFPFPEADKCLLNILHQIDEARQEYVKSSHYEEALEAFRKIDVKNPELFLRLRHLFICTNEIDGACKVVEKGLAPQIYQVYNYIAAKM